MKKSTKIISLLGMALLLANGKSALAQIDSLKYTGAMQHFVVPACVDSITIEAFGAEGGSTMGENNSGPYLGGKGARIKGTFAVSAGQSLDILVGQAGIAAVGSFCTSGGGGGSWAVFSNNLLLVAGGGGGGFMCNALQGAIGGDGGIINNGGDGISACVCRSIEPGGTGGNGGTSCFGGGGGGWLTAGTSFCSGAGGGAYPGAAVAGGGGYGGGGGGYNTGCCGGSGGGGGYSGGSGGTSDGCAGGGGGSYNTGANQVNTAGVRNGDGLVVITWNTTLANTGHIISNVLCNGGATGKACGILTGGGSPYTFSWSPSGGNGDTASGLTAGTYSLTVMDACANTATSSVTITQPSALSITGNTAPDNGGCNGKASVTVTGGTAPYTYLWTGGATSDTITGKCSGGYCCKVTDAHGCLDSTCVNIPLVLGMQNITTSGSISFYPDPNNGRFTVSGVEKGQVIEIYNYMGQKLSTVIADKAKAVQFDISDKVAGIYLVRIKSSDGKLVTEKKIVKQ